MFHYIKDRGPLPPACSGSRCSSLPSWPLHLLCHEGAPCFKDQVYCMTYDPLLDFGPRSSLQQEKECVSCHRLTTPWAVNVGGCPNLRIMFFLTLFKKPLTPPPPSFWTFGRFFWRTGRHFALDQIRRRPEETISNIPLYLSNSTLKESF